MDTAVFIALLKDVDCQAKQLPFQRRLYLALKEGITKGILAGGLRLPSSRALADELKVARNSVLFAYEQLSAEGYLLTTRQGTRVAKLPALPVAGNTDEQTCTLPSLSARALAIPFHWRTQSDIVKAFTPGIPDIAKFPLSQWRSLVERVYAEINPRRLTFGEIGGEPELREAIATYIRASRGVACAAEDVVITHGARGALDLCSRMLADPGQTAWLENPGYYGALITMQTAGLRIHPISVDEHGINPSNEDWALHPPRLIYLTPAHQYPMGSVLSISRRYELLQRACQANAWIIEDDYDSEFRYKQDPIPSMYSLIPNSAVIYIGTFSKTLLPVLRLGFAVVPRAISRSLSNIGAQFSKPGHVVEQLALARLINSGRYSQHIKVMSKFYAEKQAVLRESLDKHLGGMVSVTGGEAGMHLTAVFNEKIDDLAVHERAKQMNLVVAPLSYYYFGETKSNARHGMILGYGTIPVSIIDSSVMRLKTAIVSR